MMDIGVHFRHRLDRLKWHFCRLCGHYPVLAGLDQGEQMGSDELDRRKAKLVEALTREPGMHQIVEKALAPQKQIIDREMQRGQERGHGR